MALEYKKIRLGAILLSAIMMTIFARQKLPTEQILVGHMRIMTVGNQDLLESTEVNTSYNNVQDVNPELNNVPLQHVRRGVVEVQEPTEETIETTEIRDDNKTITAVPEQPVISHVENTPQSTDEINEKGKSISIPDPFTSEKGGIIFFIHVPKSGGTTVRSFLNERVDQLKIARNRAQFNAVGAQLDTLLTEGMNGKLIGVETHASSVPSFAKKLGERLDEWKSIAKKNGIPFFAFTVLREPVSLQISIFNYYYLPKNLAEDTPEEFMETLLYNPQCSFLHVGGDFYGMLDGGVRHDWNRRRFNNETTKEDCDRTYQHLLDSMDWIGTTHGIMSETLPIINYLTGKSGLPAHANKSEKMMSLDRLNAVQIEFVKQTSSWDTEWYNRIEKEFRFDDWKAVVQTAATEKS